MNHGQSQTVRNPGSFQTSGAIKGMLAVFALIGVAAFAAGLKMDPHRAWTSLVINHFYFMSLALGGIFFAATQWVTGAMWSAPIRRVGEAFTAYLPVVAVTFVILAWGAHDIYKWTDMNHFQGDMVMEGKSGYLNMTFFVIRNLIAIGAWIGFTKVMIGRSLKQDQDKSVTHTLRNRVWSPIFLIIFAVTFTMASFDQLMSLDPHWFSTMFGVYCFAGLFYSTLAAICIVTIWLRRAGALEGIVNENHLHDIGKFMLAFTIFWAYIGFSQFMLIWYANLPEETGYFLNRMEGGWFAVSIFLIVGKFATPFFLLLRRDAKRNESVLLGVAFFMLIAQWIDMMWIVQPEFFAQGPRIGVWEIAITLGFVGLFGLAIARFFSKNTVVAIGDPKLEQAVFHHHQ